MLPAATRIGSADFEQLESVDMRDNVDAAVGFVVGLALVALVCSS